MPNSDLPIIVGIGASAGGLDAIERFFDAIPACPNLAFVVIQHLSPDYKSMMAEILAQRTNLPIHLIQSQMPVQSNSIFLIPPRRNVELQNGRFVLHDQESHIGLNLPIDVFFRSMSVLKERAIAIILSGTGSDGSKGIRAIKEAGGLVIAQDPASSGFDGMPRNAIATGTVDVICEPSKMPPLIAQYCESPVAFHQNPPIEEVKAEYLDEKQQIFRRFQAKFGIDFSMYRQSTIDRRIDRRLQMSRSTSLKDYVTRTLNDEVELDQLYRDLLVEVTRFFRDPSAFSLIRTQVAEPLLQKNAGQSEIRIWVPGCATGEEAYSMAIVFHDAAQRLGLTPNVRVFATDVHQRSLDIASEACYSDSAMIDLPEAFKSTYFRKSADEWQLTQPIRQMVIFAPHDITRDPPFTNLDLISCRNVLIYLEAEIQHRAISVFHYGLKQHGFLFLGPSETVGKLEREFSNVDSHWRIYQKTRDVRLLDSIPVATSSKLSRPPISRKSPQQTIASVRNNSAISGAYEALLARYVPPSFLLNDRLELIHSFGNAVDYISIPAGRPTVDILKLVCPELRLAIGAAVHRVESENNRFCYSGVRVPTDSGEKLLRIAIEPLRRHGELMYLLTLEEVERPTQEPMPEQIFNATGHSNSRLSELELELNYTRESLQATVEELETSNEELQSTNEELVASNEELQSTNEELHSVNQELFTVNVEHQRKISELIELTDDMENFIRSTAIAILFLDRNFCIRRFTPAITSVFNLLDQDIGRPIDQFSGNIQSEEFVLDVQRVLATKNTAERDVMAQNGALFLQRISPYFTLNGEIEGVVAAFTEISVLRDFASRVKLYDEDLQAMQAIIMALSEELRSSKGFARLQIDGWQLLELRMRGLAQYCALIARPCKPDVIDFAKLLEDIHIDLSVDFPNCRRQVEVGDVPHCQADYFELRLLLGNLIRNAFENNPSQEPKVRISGELLSNAVTFCVNDFGLGIPVEEAESVLQPFYQLKRHAGKLRKGIGLTLAKRIAIRHGGNLWFESIPRERTKFFFTLRRNIQTATLPT